ncbi:hypothetical protein ACGYLO_16615 [Sulfitobacter sp. 1A13353]|uniref:hypothetical protein n=1 Tax=Sulfitobacter sp. 1A13353 TaxID=3368568 RepID=UPI0037462D48
MRYFIIPALGLLGACATPQDMASSCQTYGFKPGTDSYAQCMQKEAHANNQRREHMRAKLREMGRPPEVTHCQADMLGTGFQCSTF